MSHGRTYYFAFALYADGSCALLRGSTLEEAAAVRDRLRCTLPVHLGLTKTPAAEAEARAWLGLLGYRVNALWDGRAAARVAQ